tara:strand:- start:14024 stop:14305 length:282 start_codon:yes stop_codon:yes gene_type:complete
MTNYEDDNSGLVLAVKSKKRKSGHRTVQKLLDYLESRGSFESRVTDSIQKWSDLFHMADEGVVLSVRQRMKGKKKKIINTSNDSNIQANSDDD